MATKRRRAVTPPDAQTLLPADSPLSKLFTSVSGNVQASGLSADSTQSPLNPRAPQSEADTPSQSFAISQLVRSLEQSENAHPTLSSPSPSHTGSDQAPMAKASRTNPPPARQLLCTLPPTCSRSRPTYLASSEEMERHYSKFHAFICEAEGCNCVFPEGRLLDLHFTECHDPLAALRKERGEKIFACHLQTCNRMFATPKSRRLHLISAHGFPSQYFFAVTNKGVGGLLKKWGEGASMIRGDWKPRDSDADNGMSVDRDDGEQDESSSSEEEDDEDMDDAETVQGSKSDDEDEVIGALGSAMGSLSLVPPSIRFGRGSNRAVTTRTRASVAKSPQEGGNVQAGAADKVEKKGEQAKVENHAASVHAGTTKAKEGAAVGMHVEEDSNDENMEAENAVEEGEAGNSVGQAAPSGRGGTHGGRPFMRGRGSPRGTGRGMATRGGHRGAAHGHTERGGHANMRGGAMGMPSRGKGVAGFNPVGGQGPAPGMVPMSVIMRARGRGVALARARARAAAAFNSRGRGTS